MAIVAFQVRNLGQERLTNVRVSEVIDNMHVIKESSYASVLDPTGEAEEAEAELSFVPPILYNDVLDGKQPLFVEFEITSDSEWSKGYHACASYDYIADARQFVRRLGCLPDRIEQMERLHLK